MPQQLVDIRVETEAGRTVWLTLRMRYKPLLGARHICGTGVDDLGTGGTNERVRTMVQSLA